LTLGGTAVWRRYLGYDDVVDYDSAAYGAGRTVGTVHSNALIFVNPCNLSRGARAGWTGIQALRLSGQLDAAGQALANGDVHAAVDNLAAVHGILQSAMNPPCFPAGTPIVTPDGHKPIEQLQAGDWIIAAPEDDAEAAPRPQQIGELIAQVSPLLNVHVGGRVIRSTPEHPSKSATCCEAMTGNGCASMR
jgi:hypothetical protein